jgi:2,3-bisphosphoglycerate-independent phosphoglycerate mutase
MRTRDGTQRDGPVVLVLIEGRASKAGIDREARLDAVVSGRTPRNAAALIDQALRDGNLADNGIIRALIGRAKDLGGRLHLCGLVSDGGVHSSMDHLFALIDVARHGRVRVVVHAVLDGVDVEPRTAVSYVRAVEGRLAGGSGRVGTISGRLWAMDDRGRWDRIEKVYRAILAAEVRRADSAIRGIEEAYESGASDESVEPFVVFDYPGVSPVDVALHFNFHPDGARELTRVLASPMFDRFTRRGGRAPFVGRLACMTTYDRSLGLPVVFPEEPLRNLLSEVVSRAGLRQLRCAGTAVDVAEAVEDALRSDRYDFVVAPLGAGPPEVLDASLARVLETTRGVGGAVFVVSCDSDAEVVYVDHRHPGARLRDGGRVCDLAPTILDRLGLSPPPEMTGRSLLVV